MSEIVQEYNKFVVTDKFVKDGDYKEGMYLSWRDQDYRPERRYILRVTHGPNGAGKFACVIEEVHPTYNGVGTVGTMEEWWVCEYDFNVVKRKAEKILAPKKELSELEMVLSL